MQDSGWVTAVIWTHEIKAFEISSKLIVNMLPSVLQALEVLPVAPPPPPRELSEQEQQKLEEQEEDTLRELRLFLRDVTNRLAQDKRFKAFTKPVDTEEVSVITFNKPNHCVQVF